MPPMVSGFVRASGVSGPSLKSKVSTWEGAPASRMKTTFFALPFVAAPPRFTTSWPSAGRPARNIPATPVPAWKKARRER